MSPDAELMLIFGTLHLIALALGALLFVMFLRSESTKPWQPPDEDDGGGGGGNDRLPGRPKSSPPGGLPLPDAVPPAVRLRSCERSRTSGATASGSGRPPDGEPLGFTDTRSLPPPPPSSSSGGGWLCPVSERRNMTKSSAPSATATRCSTPKMSISSASGDIAFNLPAMGMDQNPFR